MEEFRPVEFIEDITPGEKPKEDEEDVSGGVELAATPIIAKKSTRKKLFDNFFLGDFKTIRNYLIWDVTVPLLKKTAEDILHMILFGGKGGSSQPKHYESEDFYSPVTSISYDSYYRKKDRRKDRIYEVYDYDDIYFRTEEDAIKTIDYLKSRIRYIGYATVADLYSVLKQSSAYVANDWGWYELPLGSDTYFTRTLKGTYLLDLPKAQPIERRRRD